MKQGCFYRDGSVCAFRGEAAPFRSGGDFRQEPVQPLAGHGIRSDELESYLEEGPPLPDRLYRLT